MSPHSWTSPGRGSDLDFQITPIGYDLAGYKPEQIAPMFDGTPANCHLPAEFLERVTSPAILARSDDGRRRPSITPSATTLTSAPGSLGRLPFTKSLTARIRQSA